MDNTGNVYATDNFSSGRWRSAGVSRPAFPGGDCPSLFKMPRSTSGIMQQNNGGKAAAAAAAAANPATPTHVHIRSGVPFGTWMQVGNYTDGLPLTAGSWAVDPTMPASACVGVGAAAAAAAAVGSAAPAPAPPPICGMVADPGQMYAGKDFFDPVKQRRLLWGWASVQPNSTMTLVREITWNPVLGQLEYPPLQEQDELRGAVLANKSNVLVGVGPSDSSRNPGNSRAAAAAAAADADGDEVPEALLLVHGGTPGEVVLVSGTADADGKGRTGNVSETLATFRLPKTAATFGVVVMGEGANSSNTSGRSKSIYCIHRESRSRILMVYSRDGSMLPSSYADGRSPDDVIAF